MFSVEIVLKVFGSTDNYLAQEKCKTANSHFSTNTTTIYIGRPVQHVLLQRVFRLRFITLLMRLLLNHVKMQDSKNYCFDGIGIKEGDVDRAIRYWLQARTWRFYHSSFLGDPSHDYEHVGLLSPLRTPLSDLPTIIIDFRDWKWNRDSRWPFAFPHKIMGKMQSNRTNGTDAVEGNQLYVLFLSSSIQ